MTYDFKARKIVGVIADTLEPWQAMNVLGHMAVALGAYKDAELMGQEILLDASNIRHRGIARFGFVIKKGKVEEIAGLVRKAREENGIVLIDFPREMLDTRHDDELAESMSAKEDKDFEYIGALVYGPTESITELTKGFQLYS